MQFHSEWLLEDPIEVVSDLEKNLLSKDEIESLSTNENFSDVEKALFLLNKGQLSQKLWVVRALESYMSSHGFENVIADLINRLPYWNESAQEEAGKAFTKVIREGYFPVKYYENLLLLILHIIETDTWSLLEIWGEVFGELAKKYPKRCLAEAFILSAFKQTDNIRSIGGYVLAIIVEVQKLENCEDILKKIYSMTQDPSSVVRAHMCKALRILLHVFPKKQIETQLVKEVIKLVEDDSAEVLANSIPLFCDVMDFCGYQCKEEIAEVAKSCYFSSQFNKLGQIKLKYIGKFIVSLRLGIDEDFRNVCLKWFCAYEDCKEEDIRANVAFNFPAVLYIMGSMNDQLFRLFKNLENDSNWEVRKIIVKQIGDVCRISNAKDQELFAMVKKFVENEKTLEIVLGQFFTIAKAIKNHEYFVDVLMKLLNQHSNWRRDLVILKELTDFCGYFDCSHIFEGLTEVLMKFLTQGAFLIKEQSAHLLAEIFYKSLFRKEELSTLIISKLGRSKVSYDRISFIMFCSALSTISSHSLFCRLFMPTLLNCVNDPVKDVVYFFAKNYLNFRLALPFGDLDLQREFRVILNGFLEANDKILINYSLVYDEKLDKLLPEHYNFVTEAKENSKIKVENEVQERETQENKPNGLRKTKRKTTLAPRGGSHNPVKRFSLIEIDRSELSKVIQKVNKKRVK